MTHLDSEQLRTPFNLISQWRHHHPTSSARPMSEGSYILFTVVMKRDSRVKIRVVFGSILFISLNHRRYFFFFFAPPVGQFVYYWKPATSCNMAVIQNHRDRVICLFLCRPKQRYGMATNYFTRWWIRLWAPHWYNSAIHGLYINNAFRHAMIKRKKY